MAFGFHGAMLHVDLATQTTRIEYPEDNFYRIYGGGGLFGTYFLLKHTPAKVDPLSAENILVFSNSVVAGYPGAGLVRYVVTTKSPLSYGIGETRAEGPWAVSLKKSGFDAIIVHGRAERPVSLVIEDGVPRLVDASPLWGKTVGETTDTIAQEYHRANDVAKKAPPAGDEDRLERRQHLSHVLSIAQRCARLDAHLRLAEAKLKPAADHAAPGNCRAGMAMTSHAGQLAPDEIVGPRQRLLH
ncbi:MAG: aldehyde ferredoxin oxidoreductase N-terminal domain-containing protein, partial [Roseiflexaceae bacterium]